ncbi:ammonium transporter [Skermania sp. ID1734]|uniref:ammonium transporter n=1 Tax=Skermania sp. ID1734 TaxID=2597516 RepID=UPI00117DC34B|nr:ammonium transporter [Skermania sp. ID1734]TSD94474.1 ammonium transporter [Skermania sp. ID1734]
MNIRAITATTLIAISALAVTAATANADPAAPDVKYAAHQSGKNVVVTLDGGTFALEHNSFAIRDTSGNDLVVLPLSYNLADRSYPIDSAISSDARSITLTPSTDLARSVVSLDRHPVASNMENQRAMTDFSQKLGIAMAVGGLVGLTIGAVLGCIFGVPLGAVGCLPGIPIGAAIGGVFGTILAGGPTLIAAGIDLISTLNAPPGTTRWNNP